jgi:hypothetical protein
MIAYRLELWHDLFVAMAGAAAAFLCPPISFLPADCFCRWLGWAG